MAFNEVFITIQDKRYEDALSSDPKPHRGIKISKKQIAAEHIQKKKYNFDNIIRRPLGRHFLKSYADVSEKTNGTIISYTRDRNGPEHKLIAFLRDFFELGKRYRDSLVPLDDLLLLVDRHDMVDFFNEAVSDDVKNLPHKSEISITVENLSKKEPAPMMTFDSLHKALEEEIGEIRFIKPKPSVGNESNPPVLVHNSSSAPQQRLNQNFPSVSVNEFSAYDESEGPGGLMSVATTTVTAMKRSTTMASTIVGDADSIFEESTGSLMQVSPLFAQTADINQKILKYAKEKLKLLYFRLKDDADMMNEYVRFTIFAARRISEKNVQRHRALGQGAFGTVYGCMIGEIGTLMAMKEMGKKRIKKKRASKQVRAELATLKALSQHPSPYCMSLRYAYTTKDSYNLIIPLALGGDLKLRLKSVGGPFELTRAKIYAAEIAFGLGHLHKLGFIHRDIKLRNVLLDNMGHCKISDFGLALKMGNKVHKGRAGTDGYWSPEVISKQSYSYDCDWWSYGCCVYEMVAGFHPFSRGHTSLETRNDGTLSGEVIFNEDFDAGAKAVTTELLQFDRSKRICTARDSLDDLFDKRFSFWEDVDLQAIRLGSGPTAWKPVKGEVYAPKQQDIYDGNGNDAKVKVTKDDAIEFPYYVDAHRHEEDLVEVLHNQTPHPRLSNSTEWTSVEESAALKASCECVIN